MSEPLQIGDYVLATKWSDGDPCDPFCVGFVAGETGHTPPRILVQDGQGALFRAGGFRRAEKITQREGEALLALFPQISNISGLSLWEHLARLRGEIGLAARGETMSEKTAFRRKLEGLINGHAMESGSDTPDWILAEYLTDCLTAFDAAVTKRERWYGRAPQEADAAVSAELDGEP
jgi:hypothetical protein